MSSASEHSVDVSAGTIHYDDAGIGPTLVFIHGVFMNRQLWSSVVTKLAPHFRCIAPTLPLGGHTYAMHRDADLTPRGLALLIAELLEKLNLRDVTLIGNNTGGALCQLVIAHYPERVSKLVLTNCDAFESFPPRILAPLYAAAHLPGFFWAFAGALRWGPLQRLFFASVARCKPDPGFLHAALGPFITNSRVRRDLRKTIRAISARDTLTAARAFESFHNPVLVLWGTDDLFFPTKLARRLASSFPVARLELVPGARTFVPQDNPTAFARSLERFLAAPAIA